MVHAQPSYPEQRRGGVLVALAHPGTRGAIRDTLEAGGFLVDEMDSAGELLSLLENAGASPERTGLPEVFIVDAALLNGETELRRAIDASGCGSQVIAVLAGPPPEGGYSHLSADIPCLREPIEAELLLSEVAALATAFSMRSTEQP